MRRLKHNFKKGMAFVLSLAMVAGLVPAMSGGANTVQAATGSGTGIGALPWEKSLAGIAFSLTGPVAQALSLIMVVIGIGVLMFGGDLAGWARWVAFGALAAGTLGGAANLISLLGVTGSLI